MAAAPRPRHGRMRTTDSDVLEYYFATMGSPPEAATGDADEALFDGSSSIYSIDTLRTARSDEGHDAFDDARRASLRRAFRCLCQVGLHVANRHHDKRTAERLVHEAERDVDEMARRLVMATLDGLDSIDSSNHAIGTVTSALVPPSGGSGSPVDDPELLRLQDAAAKAQQLKADLATTVARLGVEERVLLQPALEQWRQAVADVRLHPPEGAEPEEVPERRRAEETALADDGPHGASVDPLSVDGLGQATREFENLLPRLGHQRLQHLLNCVTRALHRDTPVDGPTQVQTYI